MMLGQKGIMASVGQAQDAIAKLQQGQNALQEHMSKMDQRVPAISARQAALVKAQFAPSGAEFLDERMAATTPRRRSGSSTLCPTWAAPPSGVCAECQ